MVREIRRLLHLGQLSLPPDLDRDAAVRLLDKVESSVWNVRIERPYSHGRGLAVYLARYLRQPTEAPTLRSRATEQPGWRRWAVDPSRTTA